MTAPLGEDPDLELLGDVGRGDAAAARMMVARKLPRLLALATRMLGDPIEAEDVAQECFVRLWRQAPLWRPGEGRVDTWLHRVVLNLVRNAIEAMEQVERRELTIGTRAGTLCCAGRGRPAAKWRRRYQAAGRQREAIVLQYYQELSNIEAAAAMEISVEALESLLARARRRLRRLLGD